MLAILLSSKHLTTAITIFTLFLLEYLTVKYQSKLVDSKFLNGTAHFTYKNVKNCLNTNIYSYLDTSGGQSSNL
jgi:hypothetical protein